MKVRFIKFFSAGILLLWFTDVSAGDSVKVFTIEDLFRQVVAFHPVAKQAELLPENARQEIRLARGVFDPVLSSKYYNKSLKGNNYFDLWDTYLQVPVWYGTDFKAGYERNAGPNVNPEDYTPKGGLTYAGISVPLGQGLLIDERRNTLKQARLLKDMAQAEQVKVINKLLFQAAKDYWDWMLGYNKWQMNLRGYELAKVRQKGVRERIINGDMAAIDSVEAHIQVRNMEVLVEQSFLEYRNATLALSNHLWKEDLVPVEITVNLIPSEAGSEPVMMSRDSLENMLARASQNHPELVKLSGKIKQLEMEQVYLKDKLKPKFNIEYNFLQQAVSPFSESLNTAYLSNNYKFGLSFTQPLFLRRERGKLQMNKLKISEAGYVFAQTNREILNTINAAYNEWVALQNQIRLQEEVVKYTEVLREGEQRKFENGESSIFLINQRDISLINSRIKLYELKSKFGKNKVYLHWAAGSIPLEF